MQRSISVVSRRLRDDFSIVPSKRPKHAVMEESAQELLCMSSKKACLDDTTFANIAHMTLSAAELGRT